MQLEQIFSGSLPEQEVVREDTAHNTTMAKPTKLN